MEVLFKRLFELKHKLVHRESVKELIQDISKSFQNINQAKWSSIELGVASFFDPHNGVLYIIQNFELQPSSQQSLLNCFRQILTLQLPSLKLYRHEIWKFLQSYLLTRLNNRALLSDFDASLFIDSCHLSLGCNESPDHYIPDFLSILKTTVFKWIWNMTNASFKILSFMLEKYPHQIKMTEDEQASLFNTLDSYSWKNETLYMFFDCLSYLLNLDSFMKKKDQGRKLSASLKPRLKEEMIINLPLSDSISNFIKGNFTKCDFFCTHSWFATFQKIVNSPLDNIGISLRVHCAQHYFKGLLTHNKQTEFMNYYEYFKQCAFESKPLELFSVYYLKYLLSTKSEIIPSPERVILYNRIVHHLYLRFGSNNNGVPLSECLELFSVLCLQSTKYFDDHITLFENILFSTIMTYVDLMDVDSKEEILKKIFVSIYVYHKYSRNLDNLVSECVIKQCSHKWIFNSETNKDNQFTTHHQYISFWVKIMTFNMNNCIIDISDAEAESLRNKLCASFVKSLELTFDTFIAPLNENEVDAATSNITILENMTSLFNRVCFEINGIVSVQIIYDLFKKSTSMSLKFPNINGFYVVNATCLNVFKENKCFDNDNFKYINVFVFEYFQNLFRNQSLHDGLLLEFLQVILSIPLVYIPHFQLQLSVFFKGIFLAQIYDAAAIDRILSTVYFWVNNLGVEKLDPFLKEIIPCLRGIIAFLDREGCNQLDDNWKNKSNCYSCVLKLLSLLPHKLCCHFFDKVVPVNVSFSYPLNLNLQLGIKTRLVLRIDYIIPNVTFLVSEAVNGESKQAACELLHSLCVFCLQLNIFSEDFSKLVNAMIETILFSLCAIEEDTKTMFKRLLIEICHLFATHSQYYSTFASPFVDVLLRGICSESDANIRKSSCECMSEFVVWSLRNQDETINLHSNCRELITKKICNRFLHSSSSERMGASRAFNCVARTFLKEKDYINKYAIYILTSMILSLETFDEKNGELYTSVDLLKNAILEFSDILLLPSKDRLESQVIDSSTVGCFIEWLLKKCTSLSVECRHCTIELMKIFIEHYKGSIELSPILLHFQEGLQISMQEHDTNLPSLCNLYALVDALEFSLCVCEIQPQLLKYVLTLIDTVFKYTLSDEGTSQDQVYKTNIILVTTRIINNQQTYSHLNQVPLLNDFIVRYFTFPWKLGVSVSSYKEEMGAKMVQLFKILPYRQQRILHVEIAKVHMKAIDAFMNSLQQPVQDNPEILFALEFFEKELFNSNDTVSFAKNLKWTPSRILTFLKDLITQNEFKLIHIFEMTRMLINKIFALTLSTESTDLWFRQFFLSPKIDPFSNLLLIPEYEIFLLFKELICDFLITKYDHDSSEEFFKSPLQLKMIKETLECSVGAELFTNIDFGNKILKVSVKEWSNISQWSEGSRESQCQITSFLYTIGKTLNIGFHKKSHIGNWLWRNLDFHDVNYIKLLPYITSHSSPAFLEKLNESNQSEEFLDKIWATVKGGLNLNLVSFISCNIVGRRENSILTKDVSKLLSRISYEMQIAIINDLYTVAMSGEGDFERRIDLLKKVFVPLCYESFREVILTFYSLKLKDLENVIAKDIPQYGEETNEAICNKIVAFIALETMFGILSEKDVFKCFNMDSEAGKREKRRMLLLSSYNVRKLKPYKFGGTLYFQYWRLLQCAAYKCTAAIVCHSKQSSNDGDFYAKFLFKEDRPNWMIWDLITYKQEELDTNFCSFEERTKSEEIRVQTSLKDKTTTRNLLKKKKYSKSLSLNPLSTTSQECKTFDFIGRSEVQIIENKSDNFQFEFKQDYLNEHECMGILCGVIHHSVNIGVTEIQGPSTVLKLLVLPKWMGSLCNSLTYPNLSSSGKLLILKVIFNCKDIFKPYANYFLIPIIATSVAVIPPLPTEKLNYFLNDIVSMLLSWRDVAVPKNNGRSSTLVWSLIEKILSCTPPTIFESEVKRNIRLIDEIITHWGSCIVDPSLDLLNRLRASKEPHVNIVGVEVLKSLLKHKINIFNRVNKREIFREFLDKINHIQKDVFTSSAGIVGLLLRESLLETTVTAQSSDDCFKMVAQVLPKIYIKDKTKFVLVLLNIQQFHPPICELFVSKISTCLNNTQLKQIHGSCLNILHNFIAQQSKMPDNIIGDIISFFELATSEDEKIQCHTLELILTFIQKLTYLPDSTFESLKLLTGHHSIKSRKARTILCDILICVDNLLEKQQMDTEDASSQMHDVIRKYLLSRLFDESSTIQSKVLQFWLEGYVKVHDNMEDATLVILDNLLKVPYRNNLLGITANILFKLMEKLGDFNQKVFQFPLLFSSSCTYKVYYTQRHQNSLKRVGPHVPKFVETSDDIPAKIPQTSSGTLDPQMKNYKYYHGDYPYSEVNFKEILEPLLALALLDENFAQSVLVVLINGICSLIKEKERLKEFENRFIQILDVPLEPNQSIQKDAIYSLLLEVAISNHFCRDSSDSIAELCMLNNSQELGILFFENCIENEKGIRKEAPLKRMKTDSTLIQDSESNVQKVIRLYLSVNEDDVASDIYSDYFSTIHSAEYLNSLLQLKGCYNLSDWESLDKSLGELGGSDLSFWNVNNLLSRKTDLFPFVVKSTVQKAISGKCNFQHSQIQNWASIMEGGFDAELSLLYVSMEDFTRLQINSTVSLKNHLSNLYKLVANDKESFRGEYILKAKTLLDLFMYSTKSSFLSNFMLDYSNVHLIEGSLSSHLDYRAFCRDILGEVNEVGLNDPNYQNVKWTIDMIDYAVRKKNFYIARKYLTKLHQKLGKNISSPVLKLVNKLKLGEVSLLKLQTKISNPNLKLQDIKKLWKQLGELTQIEQSLDRLDVENHKPLRDFNFHVSNLCSESFEVNVESDLFPSIADNMKNISHVAPDVQIFEALKSSGDVTKESLFELGLKCLLNAAFYAQGDNTGQIYLSAVMFCRKHMKHFQHNRNQINIFLAKCILRAMSHGNREAQEMFPIIFSIPNQLIEDHLLDEVPSCVLLEWLPQLFGKLNDLKRTLLPLLEEIFKMCPYRSCISFLMWREMFTNSNNKDICERLSAIAPHVLLATEGLVNALSQLCHPTILLSTYLTTLLEAYKMNKDVNLIFEEINHKCFYQVNRNSNIGKIYEMNSPHLNFLQSLKAEKTSNLDKCQSLERKIGELNSNISRVNETRLDQFSPWLANFTPQCGIIEIPWTSLKSSNNYFNTPRLIGFSSKIEIIKSLRCPVKLDMLGSDGNRYTWLVKFGEDIRRDQIIQQVFNSINQSLISNPKTSGCQINTYQVIPLKNKLGIIEWLGNTTTMSEFINKNMSPEERKSRRELRDGHESWILNTRVDLKSEDYKRAVQQYSRDDVVKHFHEQCRKMPNKLVRNSITSLCSSAYHYYNMRTKFLKNYSVLSISQWILGIGDRHLNNFLISIPEGNIIGIDYGHAFDICLRVLPVPELVPFRLTPQFYDLFNPLGKSGILRQSMVNVLDLIDDDVILSLIRLFVQEPRVLECFVFKTLRQGSTTFLETTVDAIECKLKMSNPVKSIEKRMKEGLMGKETADVYSHLLETELNERRNFIKCTSSKHMVDCLIEIARNERILGLSAPIFEPWI